MKVGLTGSIASGKSTVARVMELLGCKIYYSDIEAKKMYYKDKVMKQIITATNIDFVDHNTGEPDFAKLSQFVFSSQENNNIITKILYPPLMEHFDLWIQQFKENDICVMEAAMLFEGGVDKFMQKTICVHADEKIRLERIRKRNCNNPEAYLKRIAFQMSDEEKIKYADYVIYNNGDISVIQQVNDILKQIKL